MGLDELRERLDHIDERILRLLSERAQVVEEVAHFKRHHNLPVHIPDREAAIVARLRIANPGPLSGNAVERIYRTIIEEMRKLEDKRVVCEPES
jgi:chorismate mutase/prephenate dehydratase